jgi:hypothetical protein
VRLADNSIRKATQRGTLQIINATRDTVLLKNTLLVPGLAKDLVSVSRLTEKGCNIAFVNGAAEILIDGKVILKAKKSNGLYFIKTYAAANIVAREGKGRSITEWHKILGHLNFKSVRGLETQVSDMCISNYSYTDCEVCMKAKATRSSFKEKRVKKYISPGESLAMDLGFIDGRPYLAITDEFSGCSMIWSLGRKSEAPGLIMQYIEWIKNQFNYKVRRLITDGGTEFINTTLKDYCDKHG